MQPPKFRFLLPLLLLLTFSCTNEPEKQTNAMRLAAAPVLIPDSIKVVGKDTVKFYHRTETKTVTIPAQSYPITYDVPYAIFVPQGSTTPPIDTTQPPTGGTTTAFTISPIPYTDPEIIGAGRGAEQWHSQNTVNIPTEGTNTQRLDVYHRSQLCWSVLEKTQGVYDMTPLTRLLNDAITKRQKVSFGVMSVYHDAEPQVALYDGARSAYPEYLHRLMQSEGVKDWKKVYDPSRQNAAGWVPNYNSRYYLDRLRALNAEINRTLETGSFNGVAYKNVINSIDIRAYGNWGEWHNGGIVNNVSEIPSGAHATTASLIQIIKNHTEVIPNFQLSIIMTAFDANLLAHTKTSPEVAYFALTTRNNYGPLGWRRDNWGAGDGTGDTYIDDLLIDNTRTYNGIALNTLIMKVWEKAPITGEPYNSTPNNYAEFEAQIRKYHGLSFGNGNITFSPNTTTKNNFRAASKAAGYRLLIANGSITTGTNGRITTTWQNSGVSPTYENWTTVYELKSGNSVVWTGNSTFTARLFTGSRQVVDVFPQIPTGNYTLTVKLVDPTGYRAPLQLAIRGRNADGSYQLK